VPWTEAARRPDTTRATDYLMAYLPEASAEPPKSSFYFHGHYYAGQALRMVGGETWARWQSAVRENLLAQQKPDGSWVDSLSTELATSEACLTLQSPKVAVGK
jgi:hypothetical protein